MTLALQSRARAAAAIPGAGIYVKESRRGWVLTWRARTDSGVIGSAKTWDKYCEMAFGVMRVFAEVRGERRAAA